MAISLELIKALREKSGAGMSDCKNALDEAAGDMDKAIDILRKKGIAKAAKRNDRETGEGLIKIAINEENNEGYIFEINAETDFVVRSEQFQQFANDLNVVVVAGRPEHLEAFLNLQMNDGISVREALERLSSIVGEKLEIKRYAMITSGGTVAAYSHAGEQIGSLVAIDLPMQSELAKEIAMQVAASNPKYISSDEIEPAELAREKDIYLEQLRKEGKPEEMLEKIVGGKLNKFFEDICLLNQEFIKDDTKKVSDLLKGAKIEQFVRYAL